MRTGISITITRSVRGRLEAITRDRNASQKHAWRAAIILSSADGVGTNEIMRRTGKSKTCVWRWQERFMKEGIAGLLHDKTRPSRIPPLGPEVAARVVALTLADPPVETTHWTADLMARASGISASAVRRIWKAHGLQPHRYRQFKLSNDPNFVDKLRDVVGLYVDPPAHAIVLSLDEKSQIQALDRTQPGLPLKKGRLGTMTHDYKRHGTTTLFAALNVLDGTVIGRNMQRHRHQEFMRFLNAIEAEVQRAVHDDEPRRSTSGACPRASSRGWVRCRSSSMGNVGRSTGPHAGEDVVTQVAVVVEGQGVGEQVEGMAAEVAERDDHVGRWGVLHGAEGVERLPAPLAVLVHHVGQGRLLAAHEHRLGGRLGVVGGALRGRRRVADLVEDRGHVGEHVLDPPAGAVARGDPLVG